jgi:hypothetical protein
MISITFLKSKVGGNFATAAISCLQLQRSLSEETAKVHKLQVKVVKHEKAFQVKSTELTLAQTKILQLQSALKVDKPRPKDAGKTCRNSYFITTDVDYTRTCWQLRNGGSCKSAG